MRRVGLGAVALVLLAASLFVDVGSGREPVALASDAVPPLVSLPQAGLLSLGGPRQLARAFPAPRKAEPEVHPPLGGAVPCAIALRRCSTEPQLCLAAVERCPTEPCVRFLGGPAYVDHRTRRACQPSPVPYDRVTAPVPGEGP